MVRRKGEKKKPYSIGKRGGRAKGLDRYIRA